MKEEMSAIDKYRAQWQPNEKRIAELRADIQMAKDSGAILAALAIEELLWAEMRPPRHLPIKNWDRVEPA